MNFRPNAAERCISLDEGNQISPLTSACSLAIHEPSRKNRLYSSVRALAPRHADVEAIRTCRLLSEGSRSPVTQCHRAGDGSADDLFERVLPAESVDVTVDDLV